MFLCVEAVAMVLFQVILYVYVCALKVLLRPRPHKPTRQTIAEHTKMFSLWTFCSSLDCKIEWFYTYVYLYLKHGNSMKVKRELPHCQPCVCVHYSVGRLLAQQLFVAKWAVHLRGDSVMRLIWCNRKLNPHQAQWEKRVCKEDLWCELDQKVVNENLHFVKQQDQLVRHQQWNHV